MLETFVRSCHKQYGPIVITICFVPLLMDRYYIDPFHSSGNSSLFQTELISLLIAQRIVLPPALISSAGI